MDYEDMIKEDPKPNEAALELDPERELEAVEPRAKSPWKAFILTGLLAALIGAAGGGYGAYEGLKKFSPAPAAQVEVDLSPIETKLAGLTKRVREAEAAAQKAAKDVASRAAADVEPVDMSAEFSAIEARLKVLEAAPKPDIDPDALSALQAAQKDGFEWPDTAALESRIGGLEAQAETFLEPSLDTAALEARLSELEAQSGELESSDSEKMDAVLTLLDERLTTLETGGDAFFNEEGAGLTTEQSRVSLQDLFERVAVLEMAVDEKLQGLTQRLGTLESRPAPTPVVERVAVLAFPKAQMISAAEANMEGGLIKKTLSRHIRVKDANDPLSLIDGIEMDLSEGRLPAAAEKFERLPSPVRAAGQAWYESVKASL